MSVLHNHLLDGLSYKGCAACTADIGAAAVAASDKWSRLVALAQLPTVPGDYTEVLGADGEGPFVSRAAVERILHSDPADRSLDYQQGFQDAIQAAPPPIDVESLRITAPSDWSRQSMDYRDGWDDALSAVLEKYPRG